MPDPRIVRIAPTSRFTPAYELRGTEESVHDHEDRPRRPCRAISPASFATEDAGMSLPDGPDFRRRYSRNCSMIATPVPTTKSASATI